MHENLEKYLREISHYLAVKQGADEILAEIRSHILEKAERESGGLTPESAGPARSPRATSRGMRSSLPRSADTCSGTPAFSSRSILRSPWPPSPPERASSRFPSSSSRR
jgi:hypothetical protein